MNCAIAGSSVKVFGKTIQALSKIGDELYIEAQPNHIVFKTVSSSKSAFASFDFSSSYFSSYELKDEHRCKIPIKSLLLAFKTLTAVDKTVDSCVLDFSDEDKLFLKVFCKYGLVKTFNLPLLESESFTAQFDQSSCTNHVEVQSKLISDGVHNFSSTVDEVSLVVNDNKLLLRNYVEDEPDLSKVIHTELSFEAEEFETFVINENVEITFCLKELRAILGFAESLNVSLAFLFKTSGKPILFKVNPMAGVAAEFVLATLSEDTATQSTAVSTQNSVSSRNNSSNRLKRKTPSQSQQDDDSLSNSINQHSTSNSTPQDATNKEFKRFFLGLSQNSEYSTISQNAEILAAGSDDDDSDDDMN